MAFGFILPGSEICAVEKFAINNWQQAINKMYRYFFMNIVKFNNETKTFLVPAGQINVKRLVQPAVDSQQLIVSSQQSAVGSQYSPLATCYLLLATHH